MRVARTTASLVASTGAHAGIHVALPPIVRAPQPHAGYDTSKRVIDLAVAIPALVLASPVLLLAAAAMTVATGASPIYRQRRVGRGGREFTVWKLRTMHALADRGVPHGLNETAGPTFKARRDPRIARGGRLIRKFSVDELPQLWNVIRGEMSLVGPRPPIPTEVLVYTPRMRRRLSVKPGLTAIWQVSGRSEVPFHRWMAMDLAYVHHRSTRFDLWLLLRTPWTVISGRGAW